MKLLLAHVLLVTAAHGEDWYSDQRAERMARLAVAARYPTPAAIDARGHPVDPYAAAAAPRRELGQIIAKLGRDRDARAVPFLGPLLAETGPSTMRGDVFMRTVDDETSSALDLLDYYLHLPDSPKTYPKDWRAWWPAGAALWAKAPPFGYLAPLGSISQRSR